MKGRKTLINQFVGRFTKVAMSEPEPHPGVLAELKALRERMPALTGVLVASNDGLLVAHDLPAHIEPNGVAALAASQLGVSHRLVATAHGGGFHEVVVHGTDGYVVIYAAGWTSLAVLAEPEVNVGRLHLESRPVARAIAGHLAPAAGDA
ncbi:roadblock/LC7 domain-containing protein [Nocardia goodfellowii]|uniref:Regulator of Ras-like GTPase activity (Roadblock/LC7/MglB family) n=1 Tax=Nocardia goodfellowii TaxID=882446 RepID=A0ABS4QJZ6_9NOCA|nr:roadblock/LC7 domain-containing protein [Nocardia goodfellowii]MBP2192037.1 putative regulator of Ras-like GTPase activity (Roadblock/LC7/MglB family) [Nocardia goodfellowii]